MALCKQRHRPGLLLLHDGEKAYDTVQWDWLQEVLESMGFPPSFRQIVQLMVTDLTSCVKVNGVLSDPFDMWNGVKQGCPASPYLYILAVQPLLDTVLAHPDFRGIALPGEGGGRWRGGSPPI